MKKTLKILGIIAITALVVFGATACKESTGSGGGASEPFEVTASAAGVIEFESGGGSVNGRVLPSTVTTDLPAPNDSFTLQSLESKTISGLTANQKVTGVASCSGNSITVTVSGNTVVIFTSNVKY